MAVLDAEGVGAGSLDDVGGAELAELGEGWVGGGANRAPGGDDIVFDGTEAGEGGRGGALRERDAQGDFGRGIAGFLRVGGDEQAAAFGPAGGKVVLQNGARV